MVWAFLLNIYSLRGLNAIVLTVLCDHSPDFDHKACTLFNLEFTLQVLATIFASSSQPSLPTLSYMKNVIQPQVLYWKHRSFFPQQSAQ